MATDARHVPEFALVTGLFLAGTALGAGVLLVGAFRSSALVALGCLAPFLAYALFHADDPTVALPPRVVAVVAALLGLGLFVDTLLVADDPVVAVPLGVALLLVPTLPAIAYGVRYGGWRPVAPRVASVGGPALGGGLVALGVAVGAPGDGAVAGIALALAGAVYAARQGRPPGRRRRRLVAAVGALVGTGIAAAGSLRPDVGDPVVGLAVALGAGLYAALAAPSASRKR